MVLDDLTQYKTCHADEIEVDDVLVNLGVVRDVHVAGEYVLIEWHLPGLGHYGGKTFWAHRELVREAREHEVEHDFDHNIEHGGEG